MKPATICSLAVLLATTSASAQNTLRTTELARPSTARCPIGLDAKHGSGSGLTIVTLGPAVNGLPGTQPRPEGVYQQLHLTVTNPSLQEVSSVRVTVHGLSAKWRTVYLAHGADTPDLSKIVDVTLDLKGNSHVSQDLSLDHFATVTSIELTHISYADGSTWHASAAGACSITPDPLMLVDASR